MSSGENDSAYQGGPSEAAPIPPPESNHHRRLLKVGAAIAALALCGISVEAGVWLGETRSHADDAQQSVAAVADAFAQAEGVSPNTILGVGLRNPDTLPGSNLKVDPAAVSQLHAATVTLLNRPTGPTYRWDQDCSGTKVAIGSSDYVLTALHCFNFDIDNAQLPAHAKAANFLSFDSDKYAIAEASPTSVTANTHPIARVTGASFMTYGAANHDYQPDMALLQLQQTSAAYAKIPAIPISQYEQAALTPGEQVALYSVPSATNKLAVSGLGTYLGQVKAVDQTPQDFAVVGLHINDARQDPGEHGGSGSSFVAGDSFYGPYRLRSPQTNTETHQPPDEQDDPFLATTYRLRYEDQLRLNLSGYNLLLGFALPPVYSYHALVRGLKVIPK